MPKNVLLALVVFHAAFVSVSPLENKDIRALKYAKQLSESMALLFPVNIVKENPNARHSGNATECADQLAMFQKGLTNGSMWALKMLDSSSKIPSGIILGNRIDLGVFDECVGIKEEVNGKEIRGRHCMYKLIAEFGGLEMMESLSICVPSPCEAQDVQRVVKNSLDTMIRNPFGMTLPITLDQTTCTSVDPPEWTTGGIVTLFGFGMLLLFLVVSTICDMFLRYSNEKPRPNGILDVLRQFSLYSNAIRLLSTKTSPEMIPVLQGIRFYSMCWVILGHAHIIAFFQPTINPAEIIHWITTWSALHVVMTPFSVDTFFTISGFLMSYIFLKDMSTSHRFNLFSYYLHRYLRLTPALAAVLLFTIYISPHLGSGAVWESGAIFEVEDCKSSWWSLMLYVQNYVRGHNQGCLGHTWYMAVEMHFFWLSPLILYPLAKKPKLGLGILAAFFVASVVAPVKIGYDNKYSSAIISRRQFTVSNNFMDNFYFASHVRAAPWLIGVFVGYLHFTQKGSTTSRKVKWIGWIMTTAAFSFCVFTLRIFEDEDYEYDIVFESIYTALVKPLWGFAVSWVIYSCTRGFGGPVSRFLSFSIYTPLSRISYCVYLVHYNIQYMKGRTLRTSEYFSTFNGFNHFLSDFMMSLPVGFAFSLFVETPFMVLERIVKKYISQEKGKTKKADKVVGVEKCLNDSCHTSS